MENERCPQSWTRLESRDVSKHHKKQRIVVTTQKSKRNKDRKTCRVRFSSGNFYRTEANQCFEGTFVQRGSIRHGVSEIEEDDKERNPKLKAGWRCF